MVAQDAPRERVGPTFSLILPTYNASRVLPQTWDQVASFLDVATEAWEILFVCDGCKDDSVAFLEARSASMKGAVRVLSYTRNRGKGHAVRQGLADARAKWRIFTDVDLAYSFEDVRRVAQALRDGADMAIASRMHPDSRIVVPPHLQGYAYRRYLQSAAFSALVRCLLPLGQRDTQAGLKGFSAAALGRILPHLTCDGFGFDCEMLVAARWQGLEVREVPVTMCFESSESTTGWRNMGRMIRELWSIRQSWRGKELPAGTLARRAA